jgi:rod shape-determining protein MreD
MKILLILLGLYALLLAQTTLVPCIRIAGVGPDLILVALVFWNTGKNRIRGVAAGFCAGLFQDMAGPGSLGIFALSKSLASYALGAMTTDRPVEVLWIWSLVLFLTALLHEMLVTFFMIRESTGALGLLLRYGLPSVLYTTVVGIGIKGLVLLSSALRGRSR